MHLVFSFSFKMPAAVLVLTFAALSSPALPCELVFREYRSGKELARRALDAADPRMTVAFTHSVLGTPVADFYEWRSGKDARPGDQGGLRAVLVEERFEGEGYGLPHTPEPGQSLVRVGDGWRLLLQREVDPLVILPLPEQRMRVIVGYDAPVFLGDLGTRAIHLHTHACSPR